MTTKPVEVVYIAGAGRSGSTLLAMLLGTIPGFEPVGELRHIWARGVQGNQLCGCGREFHDCPFWSKVGRHAFGGWDDAPAGRMIELQRRVDRLRHVPALSLLRLSPERRRLADEYAEAMSRVYHAVGGLSDVRAVVDSSKSVTYALLLGRMPDVTPRVIHLLRDSRAVAHSWTRRRAMPEVQGEEQYMATFGPVRSAVVWAGNNAALDLVGRFGGPAGAKLRYESLVRGDMSELHRLATAIGVGHDQIRSLAGPEVAVGVQHTVAGNPARFAMDRVVLRPDEAWRRNMTARDRRTVSILTWPLLARYGYPLRG
jgi:hypothetical protein